MVGFHGKPLCFCGSEFCRQVLNFCTCRTIYADREKKRLQHILNYYFSLTYSRWTSLPSFLWSLRIVPSLPGSRLTIFYRDASSALLQLVNQWLNFTYSRCHTFRYERKNKNPTSKNQTHDFSTRRCAGYLLDHSGGEVAASNADAGHGLWAFWYDNRLKLPFWYNVAKDIAWIQPSSTFFMKRVFFILRACLDER